MNSEPLDLPAPDLTQLCERARQVRELCELLGFEFRGGRHLEGLLEGAARAGVTLDAMIEDPNNRPYIWDLED